MRLEIDPNWTWKESVDHIKALKDQFDGILASFLWYEVREKNDFVCDARDKIYGLKFEEWKRDKLWNYLNGFEFLSILKRIK